MATADKIRELESEDFRLDSSKWTTLRDAQADGRPVKINPYGDVFEITLDDWTLVQLFTHAAALRETLAAGKKMPTLSDFRKLADTLYSGMTELPHTGCLVWEGFEDVGVFGYYWSRQSWTTQAPGVRVDHDTCWCKEVFDYDRSFCFAVRCLRE